MSALSCKVEIVCMLSFVSRASMLFANFLNAKNRAVACFSVISFDWYSIQSFSTLFQCSKYIFRKIETCSMSLSVTTNWFSNNLKICIKAITPLVTDGKYNQIFQLKIPVVEKTIVRIFIILRVRLSLPKYNTK